MYACSLAFFASMCETVTSAGAEFIKTSTGFSTAGATFADVELMRKHVGKEVKVKAAGGIASLEDAEKFIALGADRLGRRKPTAFSEFRLKDNCQWPRSHTLKKYTGIRLFGSIK